MLLLLLLLLWLRMLLGIRGCATFALPKLGLHALGAALPWDCLWAVLLLLVRDPSVRGRESLPSSCMKPLSSSGPPLCLPLSLFRDQSGTDTFIEGSRAFLPPGTPLADSS